MKLSLEMRGGDWSDKCDVVHESARLCAKKKLESAFLPLSLVCYLFLWERHGCHWWFVLRGREKGKLRGTSRWKRGKHRKIRQTDVTDIFPYHKVHIFSNAERNRLMAWPCSDKGTSTTPVRVHRCFHTYLNLSLWWKYELRILRSVAERRKALVVWPCTITMCSCCIFVFSITLQWQTTDPGLSVCST